MPTPADAVKTYILAKDGNRPFLMRQAFAENAELEIVVKTDAIERTDNDASASPAVSSCCANAGPSTASRRAPASLALMRATSFSPVSTSSASTVPSTGSDSVMRVRQARSARFRQKSHPSQSLLAFPL